MKKHCLSLAVAALAFSCSAVFAENTAGDNLGLAAYEAQAGVGGTVLTVSLNEPDAQRKYNAVVLDPNGVLQHVSFDLPVDHLYPARAVSTRDFRNMHELVLTHFSIAEAVRKAQDMTGEVPVAAEFVASPGGKMVAYKVALADANGQNKSVLIDGRTGDQITETDGMELER